MPTTTTTTHTTELGTPCARTWSNEWIATVSETETQLNHRICGARLHDATPCTNTSDHPSGRCHHHGGFDLTGAPPGNRNHVIHGLYTRRLRTCTPNCPHWQTCPLAQSSNSPVNPKSEIQNPKLETSISSIQSIPSIPDFNSTDNPKSKIENPKSPAAFPCPYQLVEYNTVLTDALAIVESQPHPNPMGLHAAHNVATLQVLISNAATHLTNTSFTTLDSSPLNPEPHTLYPSDPTPAPRANNHTTQNPPNPNTVNAFIRLMREFRASLKLLYTPTTHPLNRQKNYATPPSPEGVQRHIQRMQHDTQLDPDSIAETQLQPQTATTHARAYLQEAILVGSQGRDVEMCEAFDNAALLDEPLAESERDHVLASYRPAKQSVSEELAAHILGNLHLPPLPQPDEHNNPENAGVTKSEESINPFHDFLDKFCDGKIPPEAFPINSPIRAHAEAIYTGPRGPQTQTAQTSSPTETS